MGYVPHTNSNITQKQRLPKWGVFVRPVTIQMLNDASLFDYLLVITLHHLSESMHNINDHVFEKRP